MELKSYQRDVIADLTRYLELLNVYNDMARAYAAFWQEKNVPVGFGGVPSYQNIIPHTPNLCFKVPTGGGKTFLACHSIKPIFDGLPFTKTKVVVWLVPSDAILEQTIKCLTDPDHPYRRKINADFGGRVEVYTKQQLLDGQNFNPISVQEQVSILVLSYDSFRATNKEGRKVYQENSNLLPFQKVYGQPEHVVEGADETALIQIVNQLSPLVIVDESHHARSDLSLEMLRNFNPCFILDLTATPKQNSNIISYVDALQLKRENMVKLPVIVYNRKTQSEVLVDAIDLRRKLEEQAAQEEATTGRYIRPIVLFQAQPRGKEDSTTFQKLKEKLVADAGITANEIAIKTADVNELRNVDLLSRECPIRYIITVNALKEGWDCPFAYILATLANKTSQVDVEQILGRILRQPHTKRHMSPTLNMSYVLTSSNDFRETLDRIVKGLNNAGFTKRDCRVAEPEEPVFVPDPGVQQTLSEQPQAEAPPEEFLEFDGAWLGEELARRQEAPELGGVGKMLAEAAQEDEAYNSVLGGGGGQSNLPTEIQEKMNRFYMNSEFAEEAAALQIPQFFLKVPQSLFVDGHTVLFQREHLAKDFTLRGKSYEINFDSVDDDVFKVDVTGSDAVPKYTKMTGHDREYFKSVFSKLPPESRVRQCKAMIYKHLNKMDMVEAKELQDYIDRIVGEMNSDQLAALENTTFAFAEKIRRKVADLLDEHYEQQFRAWLERGEIVLQPSYRLPEFISPVQSISSIGKSLYEAEQEMNDFEHKLVMLLTSLKNVKWWHRNISRQGFCLNGFINHYPDFIAMTDQGRVVAIETKGDYMDETEAIKRLKVGRAWQNHAGGDFRYYMVFETKKLDREGAYPFDGFEAIIGAI